MFKDEGIGFRVEGLGGAVTSGALSKIPFIVDNALVVVDNMNILPLPAEAGGLDTQWRAADVF